MRDFKIGDNVSTHVEGPIVGERLDERGPAFKVAYEDSSGVRQTRWFHPDDLYHTDDDELSHVADANAALN